jgi:chromosome partitioning protein
VALVDLDPRADLTSYLGLLPAPGQPTIYESLFGEGPAPAALLHPLVPPGLAAIPGSPNLVGAEMLLMQSPAAQRFSRSTARLQSLSEVADYVLLDSPPGLQMLSLCALSAAQEVLIPQQCSFLALHGLRQITENVERMRQVNPELRLTGILLTMQDRRTVHNRQVIGMVQEGFGRLVFKTIIPLSVRYQEAAAAGQAICLYAPGSAQAGAYAALAEEVTRRRGSRGGEAAS